MTMPRQNYEMTVEQLGHILAACKPVPYMVFAGRPPASPQKRANDAWADLGRELGFDHMTVRPNGQEQRFFSAEPKT